MKSNLTPSIENLSQIIKQARELEEEILSYGFQMIYFMITKDTVFESLVNGEEINCDVLRVIARK